MLERAGRHDVGMPGEYKHGSRRAPASPQVIDAVRVHTFATETERLETARQDIKTPRVLGRDRAARYELPGEFEGVVIHFPEVRDP